MDVRLDIPKGKSLQRAFAAAPDITIDELTLATWKGELLFQREAQENTPVGIGGGGGLKGSIYPREPIVLGLTVIGEVGSPLQHAVPVEIGTRPHMPPIQPLADWAEHKFGADPEEALGIAWSVARKIRKKGTEGAHMFERALESTAPQIGVYYGRAGERALQRIAEAGR